MGVTLSKVVRVTFSTITSFPKLVWRIQQPAKKPEPKPHAFARGEGYFCHFTKTYVFTIFFNLVFELVFFLKDVVINYYHYSLVTILLFKIYQ